MAEKIDRLHENTAGKYYTTGDCIDCDRCRDTAPSVFRRDDEIQYSIVYRQPEHEEERAQAAEAMEGCPVEAIGNDG